MTGYTKLVSSLFSVDDQFKLTWILPRPVLNFIGLRDVAIHKFVLENQMDYSQSKSLL